MSGNGQSRRQRSADPLDFRRDAGVSARVAAEVVDSLAGGDRALAAQVRKAVAERDIVAEFTERLGEYGLRADNLADAATGYWVAVWVVIHDAPFPPAGHVAAARAQLHTFWRAAPQTRREAARQQMAEAMMFEAVITLDKRKAVREAGDPEAVKRLAEEAQRNMRQRRGVNLGAMALTGDGFVRRA